MLDSAYKLDIGGIKLQNDIKTLLNSKGIHLPEKEYGILAESWAGIEQLRTLVEQEGLDDSNMELFLIPKGGINK